MDLNEVNSAARERFRGACRVCRICNGVSCAGEMPGMGGVGTGSSFTANVEALASFKLVLRTLHDAAEPVVRVKLLGRNLDTPIMVAPVAGTGINMNGAMDEFELARAMVGGAADAGSLGTIGDGPDPSLFQVGLQAVRDVKGRGICIIKPRPRDEILARIRQAEDAGAWAVGVDVDAAGILNMTRAGQPVRPYSPDFWAEMVRATRLPFILKGILSADEAEMAMDSGVKAIVVSNHGGRVLDHVPGTAEVLPDIADVVDGEMTVLVDGGIRSGVDALKMLALGADAVLIGRPLAIAAVGGGREAVASLLRRYTDELRSAMILTGAASLDDIDDGILYL